MLASFEVCSKLLAEVSDDDQKGDLLNPSYLIFCCHYDVKDHALVCASIKN
jgi:hypothetical protein